MSRGVHFLSLTWKAIIGLGIALLVTYSIFPLIGYQHLQRQLNDRLDTQRTNQGAIANALFQQNVNRLVSIASLVPSMWPQHTEEALRDPALFRRVLDKNWVTFQLDLGIDTITFYDGDGRVIQHWGNAAPERHDDRAMNALVREVLDQGHPRPFFHCLDQCRLYTLTPLILGEQGRMVALVGSTLEELLSGFRQLSHTDVGILLPEGGRVGAQAWGMGVAGLSRAEITLPVIDAAAQAFPQVGTVQQGQRLGLGGRHYQVALIPLEGLGDQDRAFFVTVTDISDSLASIQGAWKRDLLIATLGLILTATILFFMLSPPLQRLRTLAAVLPRLAQRDYQGTREVARSLEDKKWMRDELDVVRDAILTLTDSLEELEDTVAQRTDELRRRLSELAREKDFIACVLETAEAAILVLDSNGSILLANPHFCTVLRQREASLEGRRISELLSLSGAPQDLQHSMNRLGEGRVNQLELEAHLGDGETGREYLWRFTRLDSDDEHGRILAIGMDITERKQAERRYAWLAEHDPLTGLYNRRRLQQELEGEISRAQRHHRQGGLLFIDLDDFKYINDTSGHQTGDLVLKKVAAILSDTLRETDVVARIGGDEFAVVLPESSPEEVIAVARKLSEQISAIHVDCLSQRHLVGASIGIALFPQHGTDATELLAKADMAMYQTKQQDRGRWHLFTELDHAWAKMQHDVHWRQRIDDALKNDGFTLVFQPILGLEEGRIVHYEALLRMRSEAGGLVSPQSFIEVAEESGLIRPIDHWVLRRAVEHIARENGRGRRISLSVNLSASALADKTLLPHLEALLETHELEPSQLILEITETAALANVAASRELMGTVRRMGCRFALDDFGVGFSSFRYLKELPYDYIKIDGSFIRPLLYSDKDRALVRGLCEIAAAFGKLTVAEFVEDERTLALLRELRVDMVQGYHIGMPSAGTEAH